jgi:hypothetical protein
MLKERSGEQDERWWGQSVFSATGAEILIDRRAGDKR